MTGVITVSASTAAYAAEPIKPAQRVTGGQLMEAAMKDWAEKASQTDDPRQRNLLNLVHPPALAVFFLTAGDQQKLPQSSRQIADAAYAQTMGVSLPELASTGKADGSNQPVTADMSGEYGTVSQEKPSDGPDANAVPDDVFLPPA